MDAFKRPQSFAVDPLTRRPPAAHPAVTDSLPIAARKDVPTALPRSFPVPSYLRGAGPQEAPGSAANPVSLLFVTGFLTDTHCPPRGGTYRAIVARSTGGRPLFDVPICAPAILSPERGWSRALAREIGSSNTSGLLRVSNRDGRDCLEQRP